MNLTTVKIEKPAAVNFILGQTHFIKSVEDKRSSGGQSSPPNLAGSRAGDSGVGGNSSVRNNSAGKASCPESLKTLKAARAAGAGGRRNFANN